MKDDIKILLIDDEPSVTRDLANVLRNSGYSQIRECEGSKTTIKLIQEYQPNVLFIDMQMPEISGFQLYKQIREEYYWRNIIVIGMSSDTDYERSWILLGANAFFNKKNLSSETKILDVRLEEILEKYQTGQ